MSHVGMGQCEVPGEVLAPHLVCYCAEPGLLMYVHIYINAITGPCDHCCIILHVYYSHTFEKRSSFPPKPPPPLGLLLFNGAGLDA